MGISVTQDEAYSGAHGQLFLLRQHFFFSLVLFGLVCSLTGLIDLIFSVRLHNFCVVFCQTFQILHKYIALYTTHLIKDKEAPKAVQLYIQHGVPPNPQVHTHFL